jgi:hypothetical protein
MCFIKVVLPVPAGPETENSLSFEKRNWKTALVASSCPWFRDKLLSFFIIYLCGVCGLSASEFELIGSFMVLTTGTIAKPAFFNWLITREATTRKRSGENRTVGNR